MMPRLTSNLGNVFSEMYEGRKGKPSIHSCQSIANANPCYVVGEDLPRVGRSDNADRAGDHAQPHEQVEGNFHPHVEFCIP